MGFFLYLSRLRKFVKKYNSIIISPRMAWWPVLSVPTVKLLNSKYHWKLWKISSLSFLMPSTLPVDFHYHLNSGSHWGKYHATTHYLSLWHSCRNLTCKNRIGTFKNVLQSIFKPIHTHNFWWQHLCAKHRASVDVKCLWQPVTQTRPAALCLMLHHSVFHHDYSAEIWLCCCFLYIVGML